MARATRIRTLLMSVDECADELEVSPQTIRDLVKSGKWIGSQYIGTSYIIPRKAFERLYNAGVWHSDSEPRRNPLIHAVKTERVAS